MSLVDKEIKAMNQGTRTPPNDTSSVEEAAAEGGNCNHAIPSSNMPSITQQQIPRRRQYTTFGWRVELLLAQVDQVRNAEQQAQQAAAHREIERLAKEFEDDEEDAIFAQSSATLQMTQAHKSVGTSVYAAEVTPSPSIALAEYVAENEEKRCASERANRLKTIVKKRLSSPMYSHTYSLTRTMRSKQITGYQWVTT